MRNGEGEMEIGVKDGDVEGTENRGREGGACS